VKRGLQHIVSASFTYGDAFIASQNEDFSAILNAANDFLNRFSISNNHKFVLSLAFVLNIKMQNRLTAIIKPVNFVFIESSIHKLNKHNGTPHDWPKAEDHFLQAFVGCHEQINLR
jgi:hypothetical protein